VQDGRPVGRSAFDGVDVGLAWQTALDAAVKTVVVSAARQRRGAGTPINQAARATNIVSDAGRRRHSSSSRSTL